MWNKMFFGKCSLNNYFWSIELESGGKDVQMNFNEFDFYTCLCIQGGVRHTLVIVLVRGNLFWCISRVKG